VAPSVADAMVALLKSSGVRRVYGVPGDSLNGFTDALRRNGGITWEHVRHEEAAGFAAGAEAALSGELAVCAGSCGPGNLHLINGLYDANRSRVPVLAVAAHIPRVEIGLQYFQETHPQELFRECSVYCELASIPEQIPHVMESAMRAALECGGVAVVVIPGEVFFADVPSGATMTPVRKAASVIRPAEAPLAAAAEVLNGASRVTILAGAGCAGAHDQLMEFAGALQAPVVHAMRGKEWVEYDNRSDVGMTGLIGFGSGYRAMEHCDALVMLGTDFPYRQFPPEGVPVIQVDLRGENIGRRVPVAVPLVGTVKDTIEALLPLLTAKSDAEHLDRMTAHYRRARSRLDNPDFAGIAQAAGLFGVRVEKAGELEDALRAAFSHDGAALVDVRTDRHELSLPATLTYGEVKGFTLYATRTVLSGEGKELVELAKTNLRELDIE
jgi:pyruvate dehydrogenase (quinone)